MKKTIVGALIILLVSAISLFFFYPLVVYVYPSGMSKYSSRYSRPFFISDGYLLLSRSDEKISFFERIKKPVLYIYTPYAATDEGTHASSYTLYVDGEMIEMENDEEKSYRTFLDSFPRETIGFAYSEDNEREGELFYSLKNDYPSLEELSYTGRVSVVNVDSLKEKSGGYWGIIITSPDTSTELYRSSSSRIIMSEMDAVASLSLESVISIHYDWNKIIRKYLSDGEISTYYTFSVLHK